MTEDEALQHIARCDPDKLVAAFAPLDEKERRKLRPAIRRFRKRIDERWYMLTIGKAEVFKDEFAPLAAVYKSAPRAQRKILPEMAQLAGLSVEAPSIGKEIGRVIPGRPERDGLAWRHWEPFLAVLAARGTAWSSAWLEQVLTTHWLDFFSATDLIERGLCDETDSDAYVRSLVLGLGTMPIDRSEEAREATPVSDYLRAHPKFLPLIYRIFTLKGVDFLGGPDFMKHGKGFEGFGHALRVLSEEGLLDRARLLDASLEQLGGDVEPTTARGLAAFYKGMAPTEEELAKHQAYFLEFMALPLVPVANLGRAMVKLLDKAKALDAEAFMASAGPALQNTAKSPCVDLMKLMKRVVKCAPETRAVAVPILVEYAVPHEHPDVVEYALTLLEDWRDDIGPDQWGALETHLEVLPVRVRPAAERLLGKSVAPRDGADQEAEEQSLLREELIARAGALPEDMARRAGVVDALAAVKGDGPPVPVGFDSLEIPVTSSRDAVVPIERVEELLDTVQAAPCTGMNFERMLDGLSRLGLEDCADFDRLAAPLLKRLEGANRMRDLLPVHYSFSRLLGRWLSRDLGSFGTPQERWSRIKGAIHAFWVGQHGYRRAGILTEERIEALSAQLAQGVALPQLALPTHEGGWLDGRALVARWKDYEAEGRRPAGCEVVQALLRLAPEHREEARVASEELRDPWSVALRFALGDEQVAVPRCRGMEERIWMAAARARYPNKDFSDISKLRAFQRGDMEVPDRVYSWEGLAARPETKRAPLRNRILFAALTGILLFWVDLIPFRFFRMRTRAYVFRFNAQIALGRLLLPYQPQSAREVVAMGFGRDPSDAWFGLRANPWTIDMLSDEECAPLNRKKHVARGVGELLKFVDEKSIDATQISELLLGPDEVLDETAVFAITIALVSTNSDTRAAGVDALITTIQDGRLLPEQLGRGLTFLCHHDWFKLNRLCAGLEEASRVFELHAWVVARSLEYLLVHYETLPKDIHYVLGVLLEALAGSGLALQAESIAAIEGLKGSTKAAKLARQLRALEERSGQAMEGVYLALLEARLDRAERWAGVKLE